MPNRIIKDSICTSDSIAALTDFQEAFFYRLIVNCDDYGRMDARPAILKARLYPLRERLTLKDIQSALRALADVGCVEVYEIDGKPYLHLPSWEVHQQIRAKRSKYPAPDGACNHLISDDIKCTRNPIQSESESKSESESPPTPPPGGWGFGPALSAAFEDWIAYKREKRQEYKPTGLKSLVTQVQNKAGEYGEEAVVNLIRECMASNWQGIIWDKLAKDHGRGGGRHDPVNSGNSGNVFLDMLREEEHHGQS